MPKAAAKRRTFPLPATLPRPRASRTRSRSSRQPAGAERAACQQSRQTTLEDFFGTKKKVLPEETDSEPASGEENLDDEPVSVGLGTDATPPLALRRSCRTAAVRPRTEDLDSSQDSCSQPLSVGLGTDGKSPPLAPRRSCRTAAVRPRVQRTEDLVSSQESQSSVSEIEDPTDKAWIPYRRRLRYRAPHNSGKTLLSCLR